MVKTTRYFYVIKGMLISILVCAVTPAVVAVLMNSFRVDRYIWYCVYTLPWWIIRNHFWLTDSLWKKIIWSFYVFGLVSILIWAVVPI